LCCCIDNRIIRGIRHKKFQGNGEQREWMLVMLRRILSPPLLRTGVEKAASMRKLKLPKQICSHHTIRAV
jgi:hypothetical protein